MRGVSTVSGPISPATSRFDRRVAMIYCDPYHNIDNVKKKIKPLTRAFEATELR